MHSKFVNEVRKSHEQEKQELLEEIEETRQAGENRVFNLQYQLEENNKTYIMNMQLIENEYNTNLRNMINKKDEEILYLSKLNNEIERKNIELTDQTDEYINTIQIQKNEFNARMTSLEANLRDCEMETQRILNEYERKFANTTYYYDRERDELIANYEKSSER
jgi:hypothetical protein